MQSSAMNSFSGTLTVKPASLWHITKRALGLGLARSMIDLVGTPVKVLSRRLQCVTQWMSQTTSTGGMARISSYDSSYSFSTRPKIRSLQFSLLGSTLGTLP
jgi:hypothetical protein